MKLVFNIETVADPELPVELVPSEIDRSTIAPHKGLKDPLKQAAFIEGKYQESLAKREEEIAGFSLRPLTSKIVAISYKQDDKEIVDLIGNVDELSILIEFKKAFDGTQRLVSFNGKEFDIIHLTIAYLRNRLSLPFSYRESISKYDDIYHVDIYGVLSQFGIHRKGRLRDWCIRFGIEPPFGAGELVKGWYEQNDFESIRHHCHDNVEKTSELYNLLLAKGMI
jgi:predicted PolB exonuclease-like 3'-5' exonuclease